MQLPFIEVHCLSLFHFKSLQSFLLNDKSSNCDFLETASISVRIFNTFENQSIKLNIMNIDLRKKNHAFYKKCNKSNK
jgi:hypothetical protein